MYAGEAATPIVSPVRVSAVKALELLKLSTIGEVAALMTSWKVLVFSP